MSEDWKDKPHWVMRFPDNGGWELTGPDGEVKCIDGFGERNFTLQLGMNQVPEFNLDGILLTRPRSKIKP